GVRTDQPAPAGYQDPFYSYDWGFGDPLEEGCAITAGAFYDPQNFAFPADYANSYFYADFCQGVINRLDLESKQVSAFGSNYSYPVDLDTDSAGNLYLLERHEHKDDPTSTAGRASAITYTDALAPTSHFQPH